MKSTKEKTVQTKTEAGPAQTEGLIRIDRMYESLRYNEYSIEGGLGEIIDNSVEARAANIAVEIVVDKVRKENQKRARIKTVVTEIAVADDGIGMDYSTLKKCLVLGESIRTKDGKLGIGRFGVGMTLGSISLARRIEVYSRADPDGEFLYTYVDLDEISEGMIHIPEPKPQQLEQKYMNILHKSSGTVVILKKCDRNNEPPDALANYLGRTYRKFIEAGLNIELNGEKVFLHDPLYMAGPTVFDAMGQSTGTVDLKAQSLSEEKISLEIPNSDGQTADVWIKMSLLPKEWRIEQGAGGSNDAKKRKIDQNEGISIVRAGREVLYGHVSYITGKRNGEVSSLDIDRWWGCEISFPPELDDYFQVRYIKRGAEPIPMLRNKIRDVIGATVHSARTIIQTDWAKKKSEENEEAGAYGTVEDTMAKVDDILPRSKKGQNLSDEQADKKLDEVVDVLGKMIETEEARKKKKEEIKKNPYTIAPVSFPQTILFDTVHILGSTIIQLNVNHPFYKHILLPLCGPLSEGDWDTDTSIEKDNIRNAILLLLFAYAKAEASFSNHEDLFEQLRSQWGTVLSAAINEYERDDRR